MSEEYQWRQLGSAVNAVLMQTKMKAIRKGCLSKATLNVPAGNNPVTAALPTPSALPQPRNEPPLRREHRATGFLEEQAPATAPHAQLELPFGIDGTTKPKASRSPRIGRLM